MNSGAKIWHGAVSISSSNCDECQTTAEVLFQIGQTDSREHRGRWICRACVLDPARGISAIDRRGDTLQATRVARELDAHTAIALYLESTERSEPARARLGSGINYGPPRDLPSLPASYSHVLAVLGRLRGVDREFETTIAEMLEHYRRAAFFGPKQMLLMQWRLSHSGITHDPGCFVVSTRTDKEILQVRGFDDWRKKKIAPYLSWAQRSRFGF
jgi:hypothetical protein